MSIKGQGHFFTIYFKVLYVLCFTWPRYQVSIYRTIGPLFFFFSLMLSLLHKDPTIKNLSIFTATDVVPCGGLK